MFSPFFQTHPGLYILTELGLLLVMIIIWLMSMSEPVI